MPAQQPDHYSVLGVSPESTFTAIRKAFFQKSLACHPDKRDKSESEEAHKEFVLISAAYNVLKDRDSRREYDITLAQTSQSPRDPRFYADQSDARRHQHARRANREQPKQWQTETDSDDSGRTGGKETHEPYEPPRCEDDEQLSPEEEAWLRFRTSKNNLQGLSFTLKDALYGILEVIRSLKKFDAVKRQVRKAKEHLRFIEASFSNIQVEMDSVHSPICLMEATVISIKKMTILEGQVRDLLEHLTARPSAAESTSPEQEAIATAKLLLKDMNRWVQLCK